MSSLSKAERARAWYVANRDLCLARASARQATERSDPAAVEKSRGRSREYARRKRAAMKAAQIPVTPEEKKRLRLVTDPEFAADQQAKAERRLAAALVKSRARYADPEKRDAFLRRTGARRREQPFHFMWVSAKARAKRKGIEFDISAADITPCDTACPICFVAMAISDRRWAGNSFTLDRIDPSKGYVPGNVAVICFNCNAVKNNGTAELHERIAAYMRKGR